MATLAFWQEAKTYKPKHTPKTIEKIDLEKVTNELSKVNWFDWWTENHNKGTNHVFDNLHQKITSSMKACTKQITLKQKYQPRNPWMTKDSLKLKQKVDKLRKKFLSKTSAKNETNYKICNQIYKKALRTDKQTYYKNKLSLAQKDSSKIWSIINEAMNRNTKKDDSTQIMLKYKDQTLVKNEDISNRFNEFYKEMAPELAKTIEKPNTSYITFLQNAKTTETKLTLKPVRNEDVMKVINNLAPKNSSGFDGISSKSLKCIAAPIIDPLTKAINQSFKEGQFPQGLKIAKLQPIYKSGDNQLPENYRPISQLSSISKILEKLATGQLTEHLNAENLLSDKQFGFRKGHSTEHTLTAIRHELELANNRNQYTILVSIDLKKAFDTVCSNEILPQKLKHYGCDQVTTSWFHSFFSNREQFATWQGANSSTIKLHNISVVQGSAIGPTSFSVYINDLANSTKFKAFLFADDTNLLISGPDLHELAQQANQELNKIKEFMAANKLSLNASKSAFMVFGPTNKKKVAADKEKITVKIGNQHLEQVKEIKFLGVILDTKLKFTSHFEHVRSKVRKGLGALSFTKNILNFQAKLQIYHGLLAPHLEYCSLVWMPKLKQSQINELAILQKRAIRLIFRSKYNSHTSVMFKMSGITKVKDIIWKESILFMKKFKTGDLPNIFAEILETQKIEKNTRSSQMQEKIRPELKKGNLAYDIISTWNSAPLSIRETTSLMSCKTAIKQNLSEANNIKCSVVNCYSCIQSNEERLEKYMKF
jgi:hypothetical protein